jgi:flagellar hook-associated protein 3 FlgL
MRITNQMITQGFIQHAQYIQNEINSTREKIASTKKFQTPSDNPTDASRSVQLKSALTVSKGYQESASVIEDWMTQTDFCLSKLVDLGIDLETMVTSGLNGTMNDEQRITQANELTTMINQAVDLGNTKFQGNYIFSGVRLDTPAFVLSDASTIEYQGISKDMQRSIGQSSDVVMNVNGDQAIQPLIEAMIAARDALTANDTTSLSASLDQAQAAMNTLVNYQTANGARMRQVQTGIANLEEADLSIKAILSKREDTDLLEAAAILESQETAYQIALEVGSRAISAFSLFDYLQ